MAGMRYIFAALNCVLVVNYVSGLECPAGWYKWYDDCYLFGTTATDWEEARVRCQEMNSDLVSINVPGENEMLISRGEPNTNYWIGLTDRGNGLFVWSDGTLYQPQIANWDSGYPQQQSLTESCVQIQSSSYWHNMACDQTQPYICSRPLAMLEKCSIEDGWISGNSRCYLYIEQGRSWDDAQNYCDGVDGYLVSIGDDDEQATVSNIASSKTTIWIGLSDKDSDGAYEWASGEDYTNGTWDDGQPDPSAGQCAEILNRGSATGKWSTADCNDRKSFVCERGQLSCYPGWKSFGGNCYQFNTNQPDTWIDAKTVCDAQGTLLVTIKSQEEQNFLVSQFDYLNDINVENLWIGISDTAKDGNRVWVDGTVDNGPYMNWPKRLYPENTPNTMDCGSMYVLSANGQWDYGDCFNTYSYVCKVAAGSTVTPYRPGNVIGGCEPGWDYFDGQCYNIDSTDHTFDDAKQACENMSSVLTSILNANEESFIAVRLIAGGFYIGLTDQATEGTFLWIDGNPVSFTNWQKDEPNDVNGEDCVEINGDNVQKGLWNDIPCTFQRGMICKKPAVNVTPHPPTNPPAIGCYDDDGSHYRGNAQISLTGKLCENWDGNPIDSTTYPNAGLDSNYCRNPDGGPAPWCWVSSASGNDGVELCAIPMCSGAADCYEGDGMTYRGTASKSEGGSTCYRWDLLDPTSPFYPAKQPYAGLDSNYCRNPSGSRRPWCYIDASNNFDYCDLPKCNKTGCYEGNGQNYRGADSTTVDGDTCSMWKDVSDQPVNSDDFPNADLHENYCRNPTGEDQPWCYVKGDSGTDKKVCNVPHCDNDAGCYESSGQSYRGKAHTTEEGAACAYWGEFSDIMFPDPTQEFGWIRNRQLLDSKTVTYLNVASWKDCAYLCLNQTDFYCRSFNQKKTICELNQVNRDSVKLVRQPGTIYYERNSTYDLEANYCRNPSGTLPKPWCFYNAIDGHDHWNFCAVDVCDALDIGCYDSAGEHYRGPARFTYDGQTCLAWDSPYVQQYINVADYPNSGLDENFCRNPRPGRYNAPWCFHLDRGYVELRYCDVPQCVNDKCGSDWISDSKSDYCYQVGSRTSSTFNEARTKCMEQGGDLASITSVDESAFVTGLVFKEQSPLLWVGMNDLYDEGGWEWTDGSPVAYFNFAVGQPDNSGVGQHCVVVSAATTSVGQWYDESCDSSFSHICKKLGNVQRTTIATPTLAPGSRCRSGWTSYGDSCYRVQIDQTNWDQARLNCKEVGADLASVHSQSEMMHILSNVNGAQHSHYWIAANDIDDEGHFVFSGKSADRPGSLVYNNWEEGQPNNYGADGEDCACLPYNFNWRWNDNNCAAKFRILCEGIGTSTLQLGKFTAFKVEKTWADAEVFCQSQGGTLATISSQAEQDTAADLLDNIYDPYEVDVYWFGSNDIANEGMWVMGGSADSPVMQGYTHWYGNEPNNYKFPGEDCVMLVASDGDEFKWYDTTCTYGEGYVCENIPGTPKGPTGLMYSVHMDLKTWDDANTFCRNSGGRLAWILDQNAQDYIESLILAEERGSILKSAGVWIGLTDQVSQMSFQWCDGSDVTYTNWNHDEPNNWGGLEEDCVFVYTSTGMYDTGHRYYAGKWNDHSCDDNNMGYVCKKPKEILPITLVPPTSSGCKFGWKGYGSSCYFFDTTAQDWNTARDKCHRDLLGGLVSISDRFEQAFVTDQLSTMNSWFWTGFNDRSATGSYKWDDGTPVTFTNWDKGQPNNGNGNCVAVKSSKPVGFWDDQPCQSKFGVICEKVRDGHTKPPFMTTTPSDENCLDGWTGYGSHCYQINAVTMNKKLTWEKALEMCRGQGSELASFHSNPEEEWIKSTITTTDNTTGNFWIGLNDRDAEERYEWSDSSPVDYLPWASGQPNNQDHTENCIEMLYDMDTNGWADNVCNVNRNWICKMRRGADVKTTLPSITGIISPVCGEGWVLFPANNQCYKFYGDSKRQSWADAENACNRVGANLASIHSPEEMNFIRSMSEKLPTYQVWTGMRVYYGVLGYRNSDATVANYFRWDVNQPNANYGNDLCILMSTNEGKMSHESCVETRALVCKKRSTDSPTTTVLPTTLMPGYCPSGWWTRGNKCYNFFEDEKTWNESKAFCKDKGGGLVSVNDQYDQAYLITLLQDIDYGVWLGVNDRDSEGMFVNADGTDITFAYWMRGEPNGGTDENCVHMYSGKDTVPGGWNDLRCDARLGFMCQRPRDVSAKPTEKVKPCPDGFTSYEDACYKVTKETANFNDAEKKCMDAGGHLSSVSDVFEQKQLELMSQDVGAVPLWIGLQYQMSSGKYSWTNGWPTDFTNWAFGQPVKNEDGGCVVMLPNGKWNDTLCSNKYSSICRVTDAKPPVYPSIAPGNCTDESWAAYGAHCYKAFVADRVAWHSAQYACSKMRDTNLVSIHDSKELDFVNNVVIPRGVPTVWIGLVADEASGFSWTDGSAVDYVPWAPNEPTGSWEGEAEDCVQTLVTTSQWNDLSCNNKLAYVCKYSKYGAPVIPTDQAIKGDDGLGVGAIIGITLGSVGIIVAVLAVVMLIKKQRRLLDYFRHSTTSDGFEDRIVDGEINS